jgi:hypothetical protein
MTASLPSFHAMLAHDPEKWAPVFRKDHAPRQKVRVIPHEKPTLCPLIPVQSVQYTGHAKCLSPVRVTALTN